MIIYDEPLYRPPSEADSLIIQATLGCSHNRCTFCSMYKSKKYKKRSFEDIEKDIYAFSQYNDLRRIFLADGDALTLDTDYLIKIFRKLKSTFPRLRRISLYGNTGNVLNKKDKELRRLKEEGLSIVYLGFETGSDFLLEKINKGVGMKDHVSASNRLKSSGIDVSATLINGMGGREYWEDHVEKSAELINLTSPKYLSTLSLIIPPDCRKGFLKAFDNSFTEQNDIGMLEEEKNLLNLITTRERIIFRSNHASNALPLSGTLPAARTDLISKIESALSGNAFIRPLWLRGL